MLGPPTAAPRLALTAAEDSFLAQHGGVRPATRRQLTALDTRSAARTLAEVAGTLTRAQAAELLGIDETRLSHRTRDGSIYSYAGAAG